MFIYQNYTYIININKLTQINVKPMLPPTPVGVRNYKLNKFTGLKIQNN